ncbi:MAG: fimbrial biogenesis chaperone [Allosphingosinicella sp.]
MFRGFVAFVIGALLTLAPVAAQAARVSPMVVTLEPSGRGSVGRVEVTNPADRPFPMEVQMFRGEISETGELSVTPADDQFLVFPAQAVLAPRTQQVFRVQYVGEPSLQASEVYYMSIRQIPVELAPGPPQVQVVIHFNVLVNVVPDGTQPDPVVESARVVTRGDVSGVEIRVVNRGNRYFAASDADWTLTGRSTDGTEVTLNRDSSQMAALVGIGVVAPGRARLFFVPTDTPLVDGSVSVTVDP